MRRYGVYINGSLVCTVSEVNEQKAMEFAERNSERYTEEVAEILSQGKEVRVKAKIFEGEKFVNE